MLIKWKSGHNPEIILREINRARTINSDGRASFSVFELENSLPALESMIEFPDSAHQVDKSTLVWMGLASIKDKLDKETLLKAINEELVSRLAEEERTYILLTEASINHQDVPSSIEIMGAKIRFFPRGYPRKFRSRNDVLQRHQLPVPNTPHSYCKIAVKILAKSPNSAVRHALMALDLQRAIWCFRMNPQMQITYGAPSFSPINVIRLGSRHTIHLDDGSLALEAAWFEPGFVEADIYRFEDPNEAKRDTRWFLKQAKRCRYGKKIESTLIRYVRAFDERDANAAFLGLWSALESLAAPNTRYDKMVQRCSFLFRDYEYHRQLIGHLHRYRNEYVHTGESTDKARSHCFLLQLYFRQLIWFHLNSTHFFESLEEANSFLDMPIDKHQLKRRAQIAQKAYKFRTGG